jgi:Tol biopolymer transport system component
VAGSSLKGSFVDLAAGQRLGPYEIVAPLGAGGMGEVWRGRDTRLDREVAIKVLPAGLAQDELFRQRFEREAKVISSLSHPHICTLFDVGEAAPLHYLVMEYLEGEPLADRLQKGPLPAHDVLKYGQQIASALDAAHRRGIVHRDLKPGNVVLTRSGAKLLDFGLAKTVAEGGAPIDGHTDVPTEARPLTEHGTVLGTFQYMSPEQLEGQEADARTDIFALGAVLYEMATGRRAFDGKTKTSLIAAIVKEVPRPIAELQPLLPPALQHVVDKCLAKDPDDRWQSALDVASELRWISNAGSQAGVAAPVPRGRTRRRRLLAAAAIAGWAVAIAALVSTAHTWSRLRDASRITQTDLVVPTAVVYDAPLAVSPDGRRIAIETPGRTTHLSIRDLASGETKPLAGTDGAFSPFWAPDGHAVGFFAGARLKTVNADTGAILTVCDALAGRGGAWSPLGVIVFAPNYVGPLVKVSENGGAPVTITAPARPALDTHRNPTFLPDGRHFLYSAGPGNSTSIADTSLRVGSIDGGFDRKVLDYASSAAFVDGWLLTVRDRNLIAQRFDPKALGVSGRPVAIAQNIDWYLGRYVGTFAAGADTLVYQHAPQPRRQLLRLDPGAARPAPVGAPAYLANIAISPDGRRAIVDRFDPTAAAADLWLVDLDGGESTRLTFTGRGAMDETGQFSPDGERLALTGVDAGGIVRAWVQPAGGGEKEKLRPDAETDFVYVTDWSRDGKTILINPQRPATGSDVEIVSVEGDHKPVPLVHGPANEGGARLSPNGKWVAYDSNESGRSEIYVTSYPGATAKWQVSTEGGSSPWWSADGRQLYYLAGDRVVVAAVHDAGSFSVSPAQPVEALGDRIQGFAVGRSGRIVALREIDPGQPPLTIVRNWEQLLSGR